MTDMTGDSPSQPQNWQLGDLPGFYHNRGCGFSFADGHSEMKRWLSAMTTPAMGPIDPLAPNTPMPRDPDVAWLHDIATRLK
jgi:prepilin-type processing-associated H-X9-DG protein